MRFKVGTNGRNGADFERAVKRHLEGKGYFVIRSAGSHGPVDLAAWPLGDGKVVFVQCKRNGSMGPGEREALLDAAGQCGADAVVADKPSRGAMRFTLLERRRVPGGREVKALEVSL
jgi:Holliday junction resolvase